MKSRIGPRFKLLLIAAIALVVVAGLLMSGFQRLHANLLADRVADLERRVDEAYVQVNNFYQLALNGDMGEEVAHRSAMEAVRRMSAGEEDYFWIFGLQGEILMHSTRPQLEGQRLQNIREFQGEALFAMIEEAVNRGGGGFFDYQWPRSDSDHLLDKVGYVKRFAPWQLVIGSGVYTDDVNTIFWQEASSLLVVLGVLFAVLVVFWFGFERVLFLDMDTVRLSRRRDER